MSQKVFKDYLGLKRLIRTVKGLFGWDMASFELELGGCWAIVVGICHILP